MSSLTRTENLTITENLVREVPLAPIPGHALVIYKLVDGGRTFLTELSPEQQFKEEKMSWWKRFRSDPPSYSAYAVNLNEQLKLTFSRRILLQNQIDGFDLIFRLRYRIVSPRRVVERLSEDPLSKLQNEIIDLVTEITSNEEWDSIRNRFNLIAEEALVRTKNEVDKHAAYWGLFVESIKLERQLPEPALKLTLAEREKLEEIENRRIEAEAEKKRREIEHQNALHQSNLEHQNLLHQTSLGQKQLELEHQVTLRRAELNYQLKELELKNKDGLHGQELKNQLARMLDENTVNDNELMKKIRAGGADAAVKALENIAEETSSPRQLEEALDVLRRLAIRQNQSGGGPQVAHIPAISAANSPIGLLPTQNQETGNLSKVAELLYLTFQVVGGVNYSPLEKTRLISALIHLAAEAMLGDEADEERMKVYKEKLEDVVGKFSFLPKELEQFLRDNYRALKERLK